MEIKVKPRFFWSKLNPPRYKEGTRVTKFLIDIELINKGLESTTLSSVEFRFDHPNLKRIELDTYNSNETIISLNSNIFPMRISGNDRRNEKLTIVQQNVLIDDEIKKINARIVFKTPHKSIIKEVNFNRDENKLPHE